MPSNGLQGQGIQPFYEGSEKYRDGQQLVDLGIMATSPEFEAFASHAGYGT